MPTLPKKKQTKQYSDRSIGNFYHSTAWRKLRAYHIRHSPLCAECLKVGKITDCTAKGAGVVDHIKPISEGGQPLDLDNLQTLCAKCHAVKTGREVAIRQGRAKYGMD